MGGIMAVYKRSYRAYEGAITPAGRRWLVITRCSLVSVFASRVSVALLVGCLLPALIVAIGIYLANNDSIRALIQMNGKMAFIDNRFFLRIMAMQEWLALFLTAWIGPAMISPDLTNNALPLYLSRPISRRQYIAGKALVLVIVLSAVTWIPCLLLFGLQAQLADGWLASNWFIAPAILLGSAIWIAVLSLVALAVSAYVRWRIVATGAIVAVMLIPAGFGAVIDEVFRGDWGMLLNLPYTTSLIWSNLMRVRMPVNYVPVSAVWLSLVVVCCFCLWLVHGRIQAREVVRG
jgi:hypothetical protein